MIDWRDKYNPFNSDKALLWREWFEGFAKREFLPPVTIYVDPSGMCTLGCIWCNSADYNNKNNNIIPKDHLFKIADFAAEWGVKSVHVFGGGEPLINPGLGAFLLRLKANGLQAGLITNGIFLDDRIIGIILETCRWVGISLDAGTNETFKKVKGTDNNNLFPLVLGKIRYLCDRKSQLGAQCDVCAKYLMHPANVSDIYMAASLAKSLGVDDFQIRPAGWENVLNKDIQRFDFDSLLESINEQMVQVQGLESETFHAYGVWHKFGANMARKRGYSKCWASPISLLFAVDGNCYICGDRRGQEEYALCRHYPDIKNVAKVWGTEKHKALLDSVRLEECPRCVLGPYHEIVEKVFIKDQMCRYFP
jgi:MoaA/NifB/PqqE/SkfB family radical SAM enzyme